MMGPEEDPQRVERLREVEAARGVARLAEHAHIGVGGGFEKAQSGGQHEHGDDEKREALGLRRWHEQERARRRDRQSRNQPELIAARAHHAAGGKAHQQIGAEIGDLKPGGLRLADMQGLLEMLVEHVQKAIGQPPDEEAAYGEGVRPPQGPRCTCAGNAGIRFNRHISPRLFLSAAQACVMRACAPSRISARHCAAARAMSAGNGATAASAVSGRISGLNKWSAPSGMLSDMPET